MNEFVHSPDPPRQPRARAILPLNPYPSRLLYQGMDPNADGDRISLPWRTGLLTQTNSTC
ncbi:hypothetical protein [Streptomyces bottropensis]|uniref:hypothetical protein n=1 Tax=Streptomyces bottropensis TaxID=42235 RepID=UPI00368E235A